MNFCARKEKKIERIKEGHEPWQTSDRKVTQLVRRYSASPITNNDIQTSMVDNRHNE